MSLGDNATAPDGVVHRMALNGIGVVCGAMKLNNRVDVYWLFWVRQPLTCLACLARMETTR